MNKLTNILVLNGPNLNMLGQREPEVYGSTTLKDLETQLIEQFGSDSLELNFYQTNSEEKILEKIHASINVTDFIVINPGAWTHTSIALRDALLSVNIPFVEIHISNIYKREPFRQHSYLSDVAVAMISGMGLQGYKFGLEFAIHYLKKN